MDEVFFAKDKKSALHKLHELKEHEKYYKKFKTVNLAKNQITHILGWKTWRLS
jgi:hypothetical protein